MAVTDSQFQAHIENNKGEFKNRQILLKGAGDPNSSSTPSVITALPSAYYFDTVTGDRYQKIGSVWQLDIGFPTSGGYTPYLVNGIWDPTLGLAPTGLTQAGMLQRVDPAGNYAGEYYSQYVMFNGVDYEPFPQGGSGGGTSDDWILLSTSTTVPNGRHCYLIDTTAAQFSIELPTTPLAGDLVKAVPVKPTYHVNNLVILNNNNNINGVDTNVIINQLNQSIELMYIGGSTGWALLDMGSATVINHIDGASVTGTIVTADVNDSFDMQGTYDFTNATAVLGLDSSIAGIVSTSGSNIMSGTYDFTNGSVSGIPYDQVNNAVGLIGNNVLTGNYDFTNATSVSGLNLVSDGGNNGEVLTKIGGTYDWAPIPANLTQITEYDLSVFGRVTAEGIPKAMTDLTNGDPLAVNTISPVYNGYTSYSMGSSPTDTASIRTISGKSTYFNLYDLSIEGIQFKVKVADLQSTTVYELKIQTFDRTGELVAKFEDAGTGLYQVTLEIRTNGAVSASSTPYVAAMSVDDVFFMGVNYAEDKFVLFRDTASLLSPISTLSIGAHLAITELCNTEVEFDFTGRSDLEGGVWVVNDDAATDGAVNPFSYNDGSDNFLIGYHGFNLEMAQRTSDLLANASSMVYLTNAPDELMIEHDVLDTDVEGTVHIVDDLGNVLLKSVGHKESHLRSAPTGGIHNHRNVSNEGIHALNKIPNPKIGQTELVIGHGMAYWDGNSWVSASDGTTVIL